MVALTLAPNATKPIARVLASVVVTRTARAVQRSRDGARVVGRQRISARFASTIPTARASTTTLSTGSSRRDRPDGERRGKTLSEGPLHQKRMLGGKHDEDTLMDKVFFL